MSNATTTRASRSRYWSVLRWLLLVQAVFHVATNAYFLRFLEPAVSRRALALAIIATAVVAIAIEAKGFPSRKTLAAWVRKHAVVMALLLVLAAAFGLRIWGISYGLPQSYNSDEFDFVHSYLKMMKRGSRPALPRRAL